MSVMLPFEQLFYTAEKIEAEQREKAQDMRGARKPEGDPPTYRCRLCGLEGPEPAYCPDCLADTMVPVKREPAL